MLKWPKWRVQLTKCADGDPDLAELCELYEEASVALDHWQRSTDQLAAERVVEYQELVAYIENDIRKRLSE